MSPEKIFNILKDVFSYTIFTINQTPINLTSLIIFLLIIAVFYIISRLIKNRLLKKVLTRLNIDSGLQYTMVRLTHYIIVLVGFVIAFQFIGINLSGLAVIFGFLSVGIGFGLQNITSNFVAGLILLFERPIKVGDRVTVDEKEGDVQNIKIRSTTIRTLNNISIIVPNEKFISSSVINWSYGDSKIRIDLGVGVSYDSDLDTVIKALMEVAHENNEVLIEPKPEVHLIEFGDSSWNMQLRVWINNPKRHHYVASDINCAIVRKFKQYNIEIPFPQRDLHVRSSIPVPVQTKT